MKPYLIFFLLFSNTVFSQVNLTQGLIAHYPFTGNANDISGNNINGTLNNTVLTTDRNNNPNSAYYFNGNNAYIQLPFSNLYNFAPQDSFSISVWVLPEPGQSWIAQALVVKAPSHSDFTLSQWNYGTYIFDYKAMGGYAYQHILNSTTTLTPNPCWYNLITTYKNGVWKLYVNGILESSDFSQTKFILQDGTSRIALGKKGDSFGDWYKGKMDEVRLYNRVLNQDEVNAIVGVCQTPCSQKNDFSFTQNVCVPYQFSFSTTSTTYDSISWNFGDGNSATGLATVSHTFTTSGNYQVLMIQKYQTCIDTVRKTFNISIQNDNQTILTPDTTICFGTTKQLRSVSASTYCWSPATYLDNASVQNPISSSPGKITYYLTSEKKGSNLIVNGDFSGGNSGFSSQYAYRSSNTTEGECFVGNNPSSWYFSHFPCTDHTTGNGNMLLVNGSSVPDLEVWKTTVTVSPNTNYVFSTWISSISNPNPAQLAFSINGVAIGSLITASVPPCNWNQFYTTWNSGNSTVATISIINKNTVAFGNDFALDDISFAPIIISRDSVKITVDTPLINTSSDSAICSGSSIQINSSGALNYLWTPASGLSNTSISNPVASPSSTTKYIVTGTNSFGCTAKDSITVTINPKPTITLSNDTLVCSGSNIQLAAGGGTAYSWSPVNTLSNPSIANPFATATSNTVYKVTVTNADNCSSIDSVRVDVRQPNTFSISPSTSVCIGDSVQLVAAGGDIYNWSPAPSLSNTNLANPFAYPVNTTDYDVIISDTLCNISETLTATIAVNPLPVLTTSKTNDVDCSNASSQLNVTGAVQYVWLPSGTLNNALIRDPIASPLTTTQYIVTGKDINGCSNTDSITVLVTADNSGNYLMPNAFTPNNDGINDCFGIKNWGPVTEFDFSIYNRWGQLVFHTTDPGICWNGNFKAEAQNAGLYAYMINAKNACGVIKRNGLVTLIR